MALSVGSDKDVQESDEERSAPPSGWIVAFCAIAFLFFVGAFTHIFGEGGGRVGPLRQFYVPLASILQAVTLLLLIRPKRFDQTYRLLRSNGLLVLALSLIIASVLWSSDPEITLRRAFALVGTTAVGLLIYIEVGRKFVLRFIAVNLALVIVGSVIVALALPEFGTHASGVFSGNWRGLLNDKNAVAPVAAIFLLIWMGIRRRGWMQTLGVPIFCLGALLLYFAGSATGYAAFAFGVGVFVVLNLYRRSPSLRTLIITMLSASALVTLLNYDKLFRWSLNILGRDETLTGRTAMWDALAPLIVSDLWLGRGYGAFWYDPSWYSGFAGEYRWMAEKNYAHNAYIDMILNVGIIGLVFQVAFLLIVAFRLFALSARGDRAAATMLVVLLVSMFIGIVDTGALFRTNAGLWAMLIVFACYATEGRRLLVVDSRRILSRKRVAPSAPSSSQSRVQ